jgi:sugar phosphate isomerase/epimerase
MPTLHSFTRRSFLAATAATSIALAAPSKKIPVGLELYSVREQLQADLMGTVRGVAKMGYDGVEFYSPYTEWTVDYAKEVRKLLDDLGIRCFSTHNSRKSLAPDQLMKAMELNQILGSKSLVMASAGRIDKLDGWRRVAEELSSAAATLKPHGMRTGFHNHELEFKPVEGKRPMEVLAAATSKDVTLQLDIGTCIQAGSDPVEWINANPGRIRSMHCKEWSPEASKGFRVLLGDGVAPWKKIIEAAEKAGGIEHYLIEQEGADIPPMETAQRCLTNWKKLTS